METAREAVRFPSAGVVEGVPRVTLKGYLNKVQAGIQAEKAAVVLHPHPLLGGTMDNAVAMTAMKAARDAGHDVLRFNFRGVEGSEGTFADGVGELDDVLGAFAELDRRGYAGTRALLGFSFGSYIALRAVSRVARLTHLVLIGLPTRRLDEEGAPLDGLPPVDIPALVIAGAKDPFCDLDRARGALSLPHPASAVVVVPGADHFFEDRALRHRLRADIAHFLTEA